MRWQTPLRLPFLLLVEVYHFAYAVRIPVQAHIPSRIHSRADTNATAGITIRNVNNVEYLGNITLNDTPATVILDTGSSDLWVAANIPNTSNLGKSISLSYAIGTAQGNVHSATLGFDGFTVEKQAFLLVEDASTFSGDLSKTAYQGVLGLGPNTGSVIYRKLDADDNSGDAPTFRIFEEKQTKQNYITVLLNRLHDPGNTITGQFAIAELAPGFENITSQPKLVIKDVPTLTDADQHWAVLTDEWGVIGPDGEAIKIESIVPRVPDEKLVAVVDSGFTFSQVPRDMTDAIYGRVQGAVYDAESELWQIPCDQELNITFKFGGVSFPVHPLDTSSSDFNVKDSTGNTVCIGTFQPITTAFSLLGEYDIILGMSFLRNAYTLIDFGNFVENGNDDQDPYIQFLPLTDPATAHRDFVTVRLNGVDTTSSPSKTLLPASQESHSPESAAEKKAHREGAILRQWPYILLACLVFFFGGLGFCLWTCCKRRRRAHAAKATLHSQRENGPYQNIQDNPSTATVHMRNLGTKDRESAYILPHDNTSIQSLPYHHDPRSSQALA
ncbi:aspartic peptidase A1 [Amylostereum chailletii]|nr:aspartic peptidase A1 [Amylostereum chailletii]